MFTGFVWTDSVFSNFDTDGFSRTCKSGQFSLGKYIFRFNSLINVCCLSHAVSLLFHLFHCFVFISSYQKVISVIISSYIVHHNFMSLLEALSHPIWSLLCIHFSFYKFSFHYDNCLSIYLSTAVSSNWHYCYKVTVKHISSLIIGSWWVVLAVFICMSGWDTTVRKKRFQGIMISSISSFNQASLNKLCTTGWNWLICLHILPTIA